MSEVTGYKNNKPVGSHSLFPQSANEIDDRARKFGALNTYNSLNTSYVNSIGKYQKQILESLYSTIQLNEEQIYFIKKIEAAVDIINTLEIHKDLKRVIINEVVVNDAPWLLESPLSDIPKHIQIEEIIKDKFIQILAVDYVDTYCKVGGVCPYYKKNNPKEIYEHCLTLQKFDEIDKKIIAFALDRKPYYRNQSLRGRKVESIEKVIIDREREFIGFEGPGLDSGFNQIPFLLYLFSDEYHENLYEKSIETKKRYVRHSKRFEKFVPDFESGK